MALEKQVVLEKYFFRRNILLPGLCIGKWFFHPTIHIPVLMKITAIKLVCFISAQLVFCSYFVTGSGGILLVVYFFFFSKEKYKQNLLTFYCNKKQGCFSFRKWSLHVAMQSTIISSKMNIFWKPSMGFLLPPCIVWRNHHCCEWDRETAVARKLNRSLFAGGGC